LGLALRVCSAELAADLDDSDCRCFAGACSTGSQLMVPIGGICGRGGSSRTARDDRLRSSVKERLIERRAGGWVEESSSRRNSWERRILAPRLIRDVFFFGPVNSPVGAVVMISGGRGTGGGFSACCFAFTDNCESEALRNLKREKRRCLLLLSSKAGGVIGRGGKESWLSRWGRVWPSSEGTSS
jgi:hypothetical protein